MNQLPRIGITTSYKDNRQMLDEHYIRAVEQAGGLPLIVPILHDPIAAQQFTALLDGLIITGGPGITRGLVGQLPSDLEPVDPVRSKNDEWVFNALQYQPVLGICYGMQFINAQAGGTIYGDVNEQQPGTLVHSAGRGGQNHPVHLEPNSRLRQIMNADSLLTNTYHIQAISEVGQGFQAVGYSPDGVIEAIESTDGRMIGVQFHPERMLDTTLPLFKDFVERCKHNRA